MKMQLKLIISILICCVLITGCISNQNAGNGTLQTTSTVTVPPTSSSNTSNPITLKLTLSKIPVVNEEATLHIDVNCVFDAPETNVKIVLPSDVVMINGTIEKNLDLKANTTESLETTIKFSRQGDYKITAVAHKVIDQGNSWGDMDVIYLSIGDTVSKITTYVPTPDGGSSQSNSASNNQTR
jgi:hypothetical protein